MATTTTTSPNITTPLEMPSNDAPPSYSPSATNPNQDITPAQPNNTETPAPIDEKRALQEPEPALVQPMQTGTLPTQPTQPVNPLDHPVPIQSLREAPGAIDCPHCHKRALTTTNLESGNTVTAWAIGLCCLLGVCFAWIPCVMDSCKDTIHFCSNCRNRVVTITNSGSIKVHSQSMPPQPVSKPPVQQHGQQPAQQPMQPPQPPQPTQPTQPSETARVG